MAPKLGDIEVSERVCGSQIRTEMLRGGQDFACYLDKIDGLRKELNCGDDVQLDPLHFLATLDDGWHSCAVACWDGDRLIAVVYAIEHFVHGLRTGYAFGGDYCGRGMLLCRPSHEVAVVQASIERIMAGGIHSLHLRYLPTDSSRPEMAGKKMMFIEGPIDGDRMRLLLSFDEFLGTLGKHTRRNVRSYMRKAHAEGIEFVPSLTKAEYQAGVERLNAESAFPVKQARLARDERLLALHHNSQRFGLRAADGQLVSVLSGFTRAGRFYLLMQHNDVRFNDLSLSMVLRGHCVQHLIGSGHTELQFMGGSSPMFSRYCVPQKYRSISIDRKTGATTIAKRVFSKVVELVGRNGRAIPDIVQTLCGGYLEERRLVERTALQSDEVVQRASSRSDSRTPVEVESAS